MIKKEREKKRENKKESKKEREGKREIKRERKKERKRKRSYVECVKTPKRLCFVHHVMNIYVMKIIATSTYTDR